MRNHKVQPFTSALTCLFNSDMGEGFMKLGNLLRYVGALSYLIPLASCVAGDTDQTRFPAQFDGS